MAEVYIKGTDSVPKVGRFGSNYSLIIHEGRCSTSLSLFTVSGRLITDDEIDLGKSNVYIEFTDWRGSKQMTT